MLGEIISVMTALLWATSTITAAKALKSLNPINVNTLKTFFAFISMVPFALIMNELYDIYHFDYSGIFFVIVAAIIGFGFGDTCLLKSINLIGVSRSYMIAYTFPLFTMFFATVFLGEPFIIRYIVGTVIIFFGITTVLAKKNKGTEKKVHGFILAFATSLSWSLGSIFIALGLTSVNIILANAIRYPILFLFLLSISQLWRRNLNLHKNTVALLAITGIIGMTIGGLTYLLSVKLIGISKATALSSSSPVWAALMSSFFLEEKVSLRIIASSLMVVIGIYFLI